jgi:TetR/AcrR family transcriptional regulator
MTIKSKHQQKRILIAAQNRFAQYGYSKVTMDEIAKDVEMGKASLYYYYPTKEMLFRAVIESEKGAFIKEIESLIARDLTASQKLIYYTEIQHKYLEKFINLGTQQYHSEVDSHSTHKNFYKKFKVQELSLIEKIINDGITKKEFKKDLDKNLPRIILHTQKSFGFFFLKKHLGTKGSSSALKNIRSDLHMLMKLILKGMKN